MSYIELARKSVLLRYVSEWDPTHPGKTKGGYMEGKIRGVPRGATKMVIQAVPDEEYSVKMRERFKDFDPERIGSIHALMLHVVRKGAGKRVNDMEPVPTFYHWKQEFLIDQQRNLRIINKTSSLDADREDLNVPVYSTKDNFLADERNVVTKVTDEGCIVLGSSKDELNLIALQPKQKGRAGDDETTMTMVLENRLGPVSSHVVKDIENYFKKENSSNMKKFRLRVDFYNDNGQTIETTVSETIKDTGNKKSGVMDINDVSAQRSCTRGGRKVFIESEYSLARDVKPVFQVYNRHRHHFSEYDHLLNQPGEDEEHLRVRNYSIQLITPAQLEENIKFLTNSDFHIELLLKRSSDKYESPKRLWFKYDICSADCTFCTYNPDTVDGSESCLSSGLENPRPRKAKRRFGQEDAKCSPVAALAPADEGSKVMKMSPKFCYSSDSDHNEAFSEHKFQLKPRVQAMSHRSNSSDLDYNVNSPGSELSVEEVNEIIPILLSDVESESDIINQIHITESSFDVTEREDVEDTPTVLQPFSNPTSEDGTLNTPEVNEGIMNAFSFTSFQEPVYYKTHFTVRGDIVEDCAVKRIETVEDCTVQRIETVEDCTVQRIGVKPTQIVQPTVRNTVVPESYRSKEDEEEDDDDDEEGEDCDKKDFNFISNFPFLVLWLMIVTMVATPMGVSSFTAVLCTLLSMASALLYQAVSSSVQTSPMT